VVWLWCYMSCACRPPGTGHKPCQSSSPPSIPSPTRNQTKHTKITQAHLVGGTWHVLLDGEETTAIADKYSTSPFRFFLVVVRVRSVSSVPHSLVVCHASLSAHPHINTPPNTHNPKLSPHRQNPQRPKPQQDPELETDPKPHDDEELLVVHRSVSLADVRRLIRAGKMTVPAALTCLLAMERLQELGLVEGEARVAVAEEEGGGEEEEEGTDGEGDDDDDDDDDDDEWYFPSERPSFGQQW
jgi:hypothetical protein